MFKCDILRSVFRAASWSKRWKIKKRNAAEFLGSILHHANSFSTLWFWTAIGIRWHCNALQIVNMLPGCLHFWVVKQVITDCSGGAAQLIERRVNNRKVAKPWLDSRCGTASRALMPSWGPCSLFVVVANSLTKDCKQNLSVLWYERHSPYKSVGFVFRVSIIFPRYIKVCLQ